MPNNEYTGLDDWVPIFAGGRQVDSNGVEHDANALIDKAVQLFDTEYHEAPVTVGHPRDNSPAFGWVKSLKKVVNKVKGQGRVPVLMAKFKYVVPEFGQAVKEGLYKKRSASFYPDGRLRHVGFLGGMPPAVKGLADLKFKEGGELILFTDTLPQGFTSKKFSPQAVSSKGLQGIDTIAEILKPIREFFQHPAPGDQHPASGDQQPAPSDQQAAPGDRPSTSGNPQPAITPKKEGQSITEEQIRAMLDKQFEKQFASELSKQLDKYRELFAAEFEEKIEKTRFEFTERLNKTTVETAEKIEKAKILGREEAAADFAEQRQGAEEEARRKEIIDFVKQGITSGQILPAWEKMGLAQFMEGLNINQSLDFSEGKNQYQWFKSFLTELPKTVDFGEFATRAKNIALSGNAGQQLSDLIAGKIKSNSTLNYTAAFSEVQRENPHLVREYEQEIHSSQEALV